MYIDYALFVKDHGHIRGTHSTEMSTLKINLPVIEGMYGKKSSPLSILNHEKLLQNLSTPDNQSHFSHSKGIFWNRVFELHGLGLCAQEGDCYTVYSFETAVGKAYIKDIILSTLSSHPHISPDSKTRYYNRYNNRPQFQVFWICLRRPGSRWRYSNCRIGDNFSWLTVRFFGLFSYWRGYFDVLGSS